MQINQKVYAQPTRQPTGEQTSQLDVVLAENGVVKATNLQVFFLCSTVFINMQLWVQNCTPQDFNNDT